MEDIGHWVCVPEASFSLIPLAPFPSLSLGFHEQNSTPAPFPSTVAFGLTLVPEQYCHHLWTKTSKPQAPDKPSSSKFFLSKILTTAK